MDAKTHEYRVCNLLKQTADHAFNDRQWAIRKLLAEFPNALRIRFAGKCDGCKNKYCFMSFQLPDDVGVVRSEGEEYCGYYCVSCGWGNAGGRPVRKAGKP